jgi:hypothetical protein
MAVAAWLDRVVLGEDLPARRLYQFDKDRAFDPLRPSESHLELARPGKFICGPGRDRLAVAEAAAVAAALDAGGAGWMLFGTMPNQAAPAAGWHPPQPRGGNVGPALLPSCPDLGVWSI